MQHYLARRLLITVPTLLGITMMVFLMINLAPGDPIMYMLAGSDLEAGRTDPAYLAQMRQQLGLDQPLPMRYLRWLGEVAQGNLGSSYMRRELNSDILLRRLGPTLQLMGTALVLAVIIGLSLGIITAVKQYSLLDYILTPLSYAWISTPGFFIAMAAIYVVSVHLGLLPSYGYGEANIKDRLLHLILPGSILALETSASIMRYTRSSVLEILHQDYITVARAKGLSPLRVLLQHGFPNALIPILTIIGLRLPSLLGGSVIIESIFSWPGLGSLYITAVSGRDYSLIMTLSLVSAVTVLLANLLTDISYALVDPRVKYS